MKKTGEQRKYGNRILVRPGQSALTQLQEHQNVIRPHKFLATEATQVLANVRFLDMEPSRMRQAAFPGQIVLGDGGENLPTVLREICGDSEREKILTEWIRELTPMDVRAFEFPTDPTTGRVQLVLREGEGRHVSAHGASDGTLRFLAMMAALLGANQDTLFVLEEIDNGIHPSRIRLLIDLIERQCTSGNIQVITTTHSPDLLNLIHNTTFKSTSVVYRDEDSATPLSGQ